MTPLTRGYADPAEWFAACHDRIRRYFDGLRRVVDLGDLRDPRVPPAAAAAARYLREGLPLHARDEDESLAPRLRAVAPVAAAALATMTREHHEADALLPGLLGDLARLEAGEEVDFPAFAARVATLAAAMDAHLAAEEAEIFPHLARLPAGEKAAMLAEMTARRA